MKLIFLPAPVMLLLVLMAPPLMGQGFTDGHVSFYGQVRQTGGAGTNLLQSGTLSITFASESNEANRVTLETPLRPVGRGVTKPYSYRLKVPLAYLPASRRLDDYLAVGRSSTNFEITSIQIDGQPATLPDGSTEFYSLSFANRADAYRLDLLVEGDRTDTDGDGLPDWWERLHGLEADAADADTDFDEDGWSNREEFLRGSNPRQSNLDPELATTELSIPELGEVGFLLQFFDSDSSLDDLSLTIDLTQLDGFVARLDGTAVTEPSVTLPASALGSGRLTLAHRDSAVSAATLPLSWNDGGESRSGAVRIVVTQPSSQAGNDATLWLDANSLNSGEAVASWDDRSGNQRSALQPVAEHRPLGVSAGRHLGVEFSTPSAHLFFQDEAIPAGDHTVLAIWTSPPTSSHTQTLLSSNRGFLRLEPTTQAVSYPGAPHYQAHGVAVHGYQAAPGELATGIFRQADTTLQHIFGLSYDGETSEPEDLEPVLPTLGLQRLALPVEEPLAKAFSGTLHELLVFPTALPEQKLRDVHDYLQSKWRGHVLWDFSTELRPIKVTTSTIERNIVRGGHGNDDLTGGAVETILSGGPGRDVLRGGTGKDTFVFGGVDTGDDLIVGFDRDNDIIDLSALFWGETGDARQFLTTRLDTRFDTAIPTLDTILILQRPDGSTQEITLQNTVFGPRQVIELIVEGRLRMGGLSIPTEVSLALASGENGPTVLRESLDQSFTVEVTRDGDGTAGALEVPLGLFQDALGADVLLEGDVSHQGQRAVVQFARGETSKQITFRPIPDLTSEGLEEWETAILPHFRYSVAGSSVARAVSDDPLVHLVVTEPNALTTGQSARVRVIRGGAPTEALTVNLELDGTALEGTHINSVPRTVTIPAGQAATELAITTVDGWDGAMTRMAMLRVLPTERYLVGSPHEATVYAAHAAPDPETSGFDRWLAAATNGELSGVIALLRSERANQLGTLLQAYAAGRPAESSPTNSGLSFRLVENRPVLNSPLATSAADLRWEVHETGTGDQWRDVSTSFTKEVSSEGLTLIGPPRGGGDQSKLYRLSFSVDRGSQLQQGVQQLTSSERYGLAGSSSWHTDPTTGNLTTTAQGPSRSRLLVEITEPTLLEFEMSVVGAETPGSLAFYMNGERIADTSGEAVPFRREINPEQPVLLMWEFEGDGHAVISNPAPSSALQP